MKIRELIEKLEEFEKQYGDVEVDMLMEDVFYDTGIDTITRIEETYESNEDIGTDKISSICIMHRLEDEEIEELEDEEVM